MNTPLNPQQIRFYLYLTKQQSVQILRLREAGLSVSTIARQAIRKCHGATLITEEDIPRPERANLYLTPGDSAVLEGVAIRENCPKAEALRRLISAYLSINAEAINSLF